MKVMIGYPPVVSDKGVPLLSQNRQFQWFNKPTYVYPMVPAYAATLAKQAGHEVFWADGIAEKWTPKQFEKQYADFSPDVFMVEAKTPVIKQYWKTIRRLKEIHPPCLIVLCGDHVTALPEESMQNCPVDYILTGGDYDFLLLDLLNYLSPTTDNATLRSSSLRSTSGQRTTDALPSGIYFRQSGPHQPSTILPAEALAKAGNHQPFPFQLSRDLNDLPMIDRNLTRWQLYSAENGNFKYTPGTYTMVRRDCWWGKCSFCSWTTLYNNWRTQSPEKLLDEIEYLITHYPVREIFDDTGCFPAGKWLREFCKGMISRGYNKKIVLGCNMIPGVLTRELYGLMAEANFRFVLFGLESADQVTLDRIHKCGKARDIEISMRMAKQAGLEPHVTCMVGYPWETRQQAQATIDLAQRLFDKGYIDTLQATIVIPYPGTPLFNECRENGWLKTEDWDRYDMREPVMKTEMTDTEIMGLTRGIYKSFLTPRFIVRKLLEIRRWADILYYWRAALRVLGHLLDFRNKGRSMLL